MTRIPEHIATLFGLGMLSPAPGTVGSLAALPVGIWIAWAGGTQALLLSALLIIVLGIWVSGVFAMRFADDDPSECIIDEVAGQWIALLPLAIFHHPLSWRAILAAFLLFRLFDIVKPWPISRVERWPGGLGIMADDVLAGCVAAILVAMGFGFGWL
jgi:phosphatidylglycerophosphatase A